MPVTPGDRKPRNRASGDARSGDSEDEDGLRARFQRAFEAKFRPLEPNSILTEADSDKKGGEDFEEEEESDWNGIEDDDDDDRIEIVSHSPQRHYDEAAHERDKKAFMSSKPPLVQNETVSSHKREQRTNDNGEEDSSEAANLKHDLALQRLLKESHLLDPSTFGSSQSGQPEGRSRLKALDLRIQDLGAKHSLSRQDNVPMAVRKGMVAKATAREAKRRREATENGVVLEKAKAVVPSSSISKQRRIRGIDGPGVGRFRGGTLRLSARDVRSIEGSKGQNRKSKSRR